MKKLTLILAILIPSSLSFAQPGTSARSMGLAGAYQGMARGADVGRWNPANLALPDHPNMTVDFLSFGIAMGNNSLDLTLYNDYMSQEYFDTEDEWDLEAKNAIISYFDDDLIFQERIQVTPLAFSAGQFAFAVNNFAFTNLQIPQNLIVIPLKGLSTEPIPLNSADGEGIVGTQLVLSMAKVLHPDLELIKFFSIGASFKYFLGHGYFNIEDTEGYIQSSADSLRINGSYVLQLSAPFEDVGSYGDGVGFDIGACAKISDELTFGFSVINLIGTINFSDVENRYSEISYNEPGLNIDNFTNFGDFLKGVQEDSVYEYRYMTSVKYAMPKRMIFSANYKYNWWLTLEADYQQGLNETAGNSKIPKMAFGTQIKYLSFLPLRMGISLGGEQKALYGIGFGIDLKYYKLDLGFASQRGLFEKSKGINFAISQRIQF